MYSYSTMGAAPGYAPPHAGGFMPPSTMGAMVPGRYYDIVGAEGAEEGTWDKIKKWGEKEAFFGVRNKFFWPGVALISVAWYGYYARWWR